MGQQVNIYMMKLFIDSIHLSWKKIHEKYETIKKIKEGIIRKQNLVNLGKKYSLKFQSMEFELIFAKINIRILSKSIVFLIFFEAFF
jgi:hypothetical protein